MVAVMMGVIFPTVSGTLFFATLSKPALGPTQSSDQWVQVGRSD